MKFKKIKIKFGFAHLVGLNKKVEFGYGKEYYIPLELMKNFNAYIVNNMVEVDETIYTEKELDPKLKVFTGLRLTPVKQFLSAATSEPKTPEETKKEDADPNVEELTKAEIIKMIMETQGHNYKESALKKMNKAELTTILMNLSENMV